MIGRDQIDKPSIVYWRDHSAGASRRRVTPMPRGSRPSTAAFTSSGARNASEIVILTCRMLHFSRANVEPVDTRKVVRNLGIAIGAGVVLALLACIVTLGVRPDLDNPGVFGFLLVKMGFGVVVTVLGWHLLLKHTRPGGENHSRIFLAAVPFAALMALAAVNLISVPASHWGHLMMGERWRECLLSIPIIAVVPFAVITWAVRMAAPTNLLRTGALAGLVAGGISAAAYALHCHDDSLPFVALWFGGTIVLCTLAGAALGPRLLHW